jgi:hypothetical protein
MPRVPVAALCLAVLTGIPAGSTAQIPYAPDVDLSGRYDIPLGFGPGGAQYGGRVDIEKVKGCYEMTWTLEDGNTYHGVGMLLGEDLFAAAWSYTPRDGYGVVAYLSRKAGGFLGAWCQPGGTRGDESLGPPQAWVGTHDLKGGNGSYTGSLTLTPAGPFGGEASDGWTPFELAWHTSQGDYAGYGVALRDKSLFGVWGFSEGGGVAYYTAGAGKLQGMWTSIGSPGMGVEHLQVRSGTEKLAQ